jgi:uncharacterized protein (DUF427 family)
MPKASWNRALLAESERYELVEGHVYFPPETIKKDLFRPSDTTTICPWKGMAHYYSLVVNGTENKDAAWYYRLLARRHGRALIARGGE